MVGSIEDKVMSEEVAVEEEKAKSPILKIILIVVGILLLVAITIGGTLFATGFFDAEKESLEEAIAALEAEASAEAAAAEAAARGPDKETKESPEFTRFAPYISRHGVNSMLAVELTGVGGELSSGNAVGLPMKRYMIVFDASENDSTNCSAL